MKGTPTKRELLADSSAHRPTHGGTLHIGVQNQLRISSFFRGSAGVAKLVLAFWKYGFLSIFAYRASFLVQAGFMMVNNALMLLVFVLMFQKFGTVGGMTIGDYVPLYAFFAMMFGIVHTLFAGYEDISISIREWRLDNHLLTPKSPLFKIVTSRMSFSAIGDFLSGIAFLGYFTPQLLTDPGFILRFAMALLLGSAVCLGTMIAYHSLGFYLGSSEKIADGAFNGLLGGSIYPPAIYEGTFIKPVLLVVFPTYFAVFYPYLFSVSNWDLRYLGYCLLGATVFCGVGITVFQRGIRRYESGNLMVTNV